jgi:hypothetical protein
MFAVSRSLSRLSPQIRNVGFQQQVRKNSTLEKVGTLIENTMPFSFLTGGVIGAGVGFQCSLNNLKRAKSMEQKVLAAFDGVLNVGLGGVVGGVIGGFWPITVPAIAFIIQKKD